MIVPSDISHLAVLPSPHIFSCNIVLKVLNHEQKVSQYDQDMQQSHTSDQHIALRGRDSVEPSIVCLTMH